VATAHPQGPLHAALVAGQAPHSIEQEDCGTVIINAGQTGYFRSHYSPEGLADVTAHYSTLSSEDQLGFLQDTDALAFAGHEPMSALLELADHVPADADPVVASALVNGLRSLDRLYDGLPARREFRSYARPLLNSLFSRIGWDAHGGEGDNVASLRASLIYALSAMGDEAVMAEADKRFRQFTSDPSNVPADTRKTVLRVVARHANASTWNKLHDMARSAKSEIERAQFYTLLAMPEDTTLVRRALALALSGEPPPTIAPQIVTSASAEHPDIAFEYATDHWGELAALIEPSSQARFVPGLVTSAFDTTLINRLNAFADAHIPQSARKDLRKSESSIRYRAEIRSERLPQADDWLKHRLAAAYHRRIETST
jgi:aminopeptidase N